METQRKKELENKRKRTRQDKAEMMRDRKANAQKGKTLNEMLAYPDEYGNLSSKPPDPRKKLEVLAKNAQGNAADMKVHSGKVTFFNTEKGFGFIKDNISQQSIFVHANNVSGLIKENDTVSFEVEQGERGLFAVHVKIPE